MTPQRSITAEADTRGPHETAMACLFEGGAAFRDGAATNQCPYTVDSADAKEKFRAEQWLLGFVTARRMATDAIQSGSGE